MNTPEQDAELTFDKAYWLAQPPPVRAMQHMPNTGTDGSMATSPRGPKAVELTAQGYTIDVPIMVWDWDPYFQMQFRENYGLNISALNGVTIKSSTKLADYPPFDPPLPPPPPPDTKLVGNYAGFANWYFSTEAGKALPDFDADPVHGQTVQDGVTYHKKVVHTVIGTTHFFLRQ